MKNFTLAFMFILAISVANAQNVENPKSSHQLAAEELMITMKMQQTVNDGVVQMMELQAKSNPMLEAKKDALKTFMLKYMSWAAIGADYLKIYMETYSETELKDMAAFYRTETGKKVIASTNAITMKASMLGQDRMNANMSELMELLK